MNANTSNSTTLELRPPTHVSCVFAKVIHSGDLHGEALHTNGWGGDRDRGDGKNMPPRRQERWVRGFCCHISKWMCLKPLEVNYSKVGAAASSCWRELKTLSDALLGIQAGINPSAWELSHVHAVNGCLWSYFMYIYMYKKTFVVILLPHSLSPCHTHTQR